MLGEPFWEFVGRSGSSWAATARSSGPSLDGAAQESNLPSLGLPDLTGFEELCALSRTRMNTEIAKHADRRGTVRGTIVPALVATTMGGCERT
jgi:hypothetical protein